MIETAFLQRFPIFAGLDKPTLERVASFLFEREYQRGEVIFQQGEPGEVICFLRQGRVKISRIGTDGREDIMRFFDPGRWFGLVVALDMQPYPSTATAVYPSRVWCMRVLDYRRLHQEVPSINILGVIGENLRTAQDRAHSLAMDDLHSRLAKILLGEAKKYGQVRDGLLLLPLELTQEDLAGLLGSVRESVGRVMADLRRSGAVQKTTGGNLLLDPAALENWMKAE